MRWIRWFEEIDLDDVGLVGGKNASLGEMVRNLAQAGVRVPDGFAVTAEAYRHTLERAGIVPRLHELLDGLNKADVVELARRARAAREAVYGADLPADVAEEIVTAHHRLRDEYGPDLSVAVRSSATAEDLPEASFAGQQETYLNVRGDGPLLEAVRRCFASLFTDRAISYRIDRGFDHFSVALSVGVQKMVRSDLASAGVIFTVDTETGFPEVVFVTGSYGLGETVVQGAVDPDEFYVHKATYREGYRAVLRRVLGDKAVKLIFAEGGQQTVRAVPTPKAERGRFCLTDEEVLTLAGYAIAVEDHYSTRRGRRTPMDLEWAKDGMDGLLYLVQARPETVTSRRDPSVLEEYRITGDGDVLVTGRAVGTKVAVGRARVVPSAQHLADFRPGDVLVADTTTPDWEPVMKTAAAVVTNRGGRTCHAAIVARELGIPAVVGTGRATEVLAGAGTVTVSCAEGDTGKIYRGEVPFEVERIDLAGMPRPRTAIMMNVGNPETAFANAMIPNDGVGLARMEFIINEEIRAHPMALLHPERVEDPSEREALAELTAADPDPAEYFVRRLAEGIGTIAAAFYPRPVVVRMSDFKSNEYAGLLGGRWFEPREENPMLGFRGASRYTHPAYAEGFALECAAMRRVRQDMGLTNVRLMIPFCRRVDEARRVLATMAEHGLERGRDGLEVYVMCEIPNNVLLVDAFAELFDGFSIGSNDLTQLVLGVDRDSALVAFDFDERDPGVLEMIRLAVEGARRNGRHSGICGQAPSDYPEIAEYLVRLGIESISLNPDAVLATTRRVLDVEAGLGGHRSSAALESPSNPGGPPGVDVDAGQQQAAGDEEHHEGEDGQP